MKRNEVKPLKYLTHQRNAVSILKLGILSHNRAESIEHETVYNAEIVARRGKTFPNGRTLLDYANVYFNRGGPYPKGSISGFLGVILSVMPRVVLRSPARTG